LVLPNIGGSGNSEAEQSLSFLSMAGIGVGGFVAVALVILFLFWRRRRKSEEPDIPITESDTVNNSLPELEEDDRSIYTNPLDDSGENSEDLDDITFSDSGGDEGL
jgi:hypothetical protein